MKESSCETLVWIYFFFFLEKNIALLDWVYELGRRIGKEVVGPFVLIDVVVCCCLYDLLRYCAPWSFAVSRKKGL